MSAAATRFCRVSFGALAFALPAGLSAQRSGDAALDSLAARSASLTIRYADRRVAIAEGYRRLGPDFPGMGEHWLSYSALLGNQLDAGRPTILTYATIGDTARLLGVGFVFTTTGDGAPAMGSVPGWPAHWHEHSGLFADETGARGDRPSVGATSTHVWVLHVWTALANPDGRYEPDNWALPFARAGISRNADSVDSEAARTLALGFGGDVFLQEVLTEAGIRTPVRAAEIDRVIMAARASAVRVVEQYRTTGSSGHIDERSLGVTWRMLASELERIAGASVKPFLAPPHGPRGSSAHVHR